MKILRATLLFTAAMLVGCGRAYAIDGTFDVTETWRLTLTYRDFGRQNYDGVKVFSGTQHGTLTVQNDSYQLIDRTGVRWSSTHSSLTDRTIYGGPGSYHISGSYPFAPAFGARAYGILFLGCFVLKVPLIDGEVPGFSSVDTYSAYGADLSSLSGGGLMGGIGLTAEVESTVVFAPIITRPRITQQPRGQTAPTGGSAVFTVAATGTPPLTYAWRKGGVVLEGETGPTLTLANVQRADAGVYSVAVSNGAGRVTSRSARLSVRPPPPPWIESWQRVAAGTHAPARGRTSTVPGDKGRWVIVDTVSHFDDCGPVQSHADVVVENGRKLLKLTSVASVGGCADNLSVVLDERLSRSLPVSLQPNTLISFVEQGAMEDPVWNGYFSCVGPPCGDTVSLRVIDDLGNQLVYVFQRAPNYVEHTATRYTEVFLDPAGGTFTRNLFDDLARIAGPANVGSKIKVIEFGLSAVGSASLDELRIGASLGP